VNLKAVDAHHGYVGVATLLPVINKSFLVQSCSIAETAFLMKWWCSVLTRGCQRWGTA
jgi:hypothetical protein